MAAIFRGEDDVSSTSSSQYSDEKEGKTDAHLLGHCESLPIFSSFPP